VLKHDEYLKNKILDPLNFDQFSTILSKIELLIYQQLPNRISCFIPRWKAHQDRTKILKKVIKIKSEFKITVDKLIIFAPDLAQFRQNSLTI
jgi:hypothetical protein